MRLLPRRLFGVVGFAAALLLIASPAFALTEAEIDAKVREMLPGFPDAVPVSLHEIFRDLARHLLESDQYSLSTDFDATGGSGDGFGAESFAMSSVMSAFPNPGCMELSFPIPTSYDQWISDFPGVGAETEPSDSFARDGVPNLLKYALGLDPTAAGRICLPRPVFKEHQNEIHLALHFTRPNWTDEIAHVLESSADLTIWTQHHDPVTLTESIPDTSYEEVWVVDPLPADVSSRRFLRLATEVDTGLRITATCEADEGVWIEVDGSVWASRNGWDPFAHQVEVLVVERATSRAGPFNDTITTIAYPDSEIWTFSFFDRKVELGQTYYYRARFTYRDAAWQLYEGPPSNVAFVHVNCQPPLPELSAVCRDDRIVLKWQVPQWAMAGSDVTVTSWTLKRSSDPQGPYTTVHTLDWALAVVHADYPPDPSPVQTYHYYVYFTYKDEAGTNLTSPNSPVVAANTCKIPELGPIDIAFIVDNTQSTVNLAVTELKMEAVIEAVLRDIDAASGGDYRLALVTPDADIVNVRLPFAAGNRTAFKETLQDLPPPIAGGVNHPESTDECLNTVVNGLLAADRDPQVECNGNPEVQVGDFFPPFGYTLTQGNLEPRDALRLVVLITDDRPSGFCDIHHNDWLYEVHGLRALGYAHDAAAKEIPINAIMVEMSWWEEVAPIMQDYADITCGMFSQLNTTMGNNVTGIGEDIVKILYDLPDCAP